MVVDIFSVTINYHSPILCSRFSVEECDTFFHCQWSVHMVMIWSSTMLHSLHSEKRNRLMPTRSIPKQCSALLYNFLSPLQKYKSYCCKAGCCSGLFFILASPNPPSSVATTVLQSAINILLYLIALIYSICFRVGVQTVVKSSARHHVLCQTFMICRVEVDNVIWIDRSVPSR